MNNKKAKIKWMLISLLVMALAIAADQFTKHLTLLHLKDKTPVSLIDGVLELHFYPNTGIAWSMLEGQLFFIVFMGIVFLSVMLFFVLRLPEQKKFHILYILSGLLAGGALGNMIDRIRLGYVVDFIYFSLINFPVFNVADCCIVISIAWACILFLFIYKEEDLTFLSFKQKKYREVK